MAKPETDRAIVAAGGFAAFVRRAWPQIEPGEIIFEPHMALLCAHLDAVLAGFDPETPRDAVIQELCINVPPGSSKSTICSILFPAYAWIKHPWLKFMCVTYDEKLSHTFAKRSMNLMQGKWFQARWGHIRILGGERAPVGLFENSEGGLRFSTMMGGAATGRHAHILLADDPHKTDDLQGGGESAMAALDHAWDRWTGTFCRRVADASTFVKLCVMQRLHEEDLTGRMLRGPNVVHLRLPMEYEAGNPYTSQWGDDHRTVEGELLCPLRFPQAYVDDIKNGPTGLSAQQYAGQMQQRPAPEKGALLHKAWFTQRWSAVPKTGRVVLSIDASLKDHAKADYCVMQVWCDVRGDYYLLDQIRARISFSQTIAAAVELRARWARCTHVLIEDKANGTAIIDTLQQTMTGVIAINPEGGKYSRVNAIEPIVRSGHVWIPERPWTEDFVREAVAFPVSAYDDQVDCMSQALLWLSGKHGNRRFAQAMASVRSGRFALTRTPIGG